MASVRTTVRAFACLTTSCLLAAPALGQWSPDPGTNLAIADKTGEQVTPKIAARPDGGFWIAWFDNVSGNYDVYLQRLDGKGDEAFAHNGLRVSGNPQASSLVDWDLICDSTGAAVLVFTDTRAGADLDVYAYRVSAAGAFLWGPQGVALSNNGDYEPAPKVVETSTGDFVFVWARLPNAGSGRIRMQRLSPAGVPQLAADGVPIAGNGAESPGFCDVTASDNGAVIVSWVRDISSFLSNRHVRAQKFDAAGAPLWPAPVAVHDANSVPIAHQPRIVSDAQGGAFVTWHRTVGSLFMAMAQHLDASGAELFGHNGIGVTTATTQNHLDPAAAYDADLDALFVTWNERNPAQSQWAIRAQRVSGAGALSWGPTGVAITALNTVEKSLPRVAPYADGAVVVWQQASNTGPVDDLVRAARLDGAGAVVWSGGSLTLADSPSTKARAPIAAAPGGTVATVFEDDRNGNVDLFVQNVNPGGTLGVPRLTADGSKVSVASGGVQALALDAGLAFAGSSYVMLGSVTGIAPGVDLGPVHLALNVDPYFNLVLANLTAPVFGGFLGNLDVNGKASASLLIPAGLPASVVGLTLDHAYLLLSPFNAVTGASEPVTLALVP